MTWLVKYGACLLARNTEGREGRARPVVAREHGMLVGGSAGRDWEDVAQDGSFFEMRQQWKLN